MKSLSSRHSADSRPLTTSLLAAVFALCLLPGPANAYSTYMSVSAYDNYSRGGADVVHEFSGDLGASAEASYTTRTGSYGGAYAAYAMGSFSLASGTIAFDLEATGYDAVASVYVELLDEIYPFWGQPGRQDVIPVELTWEVTGSYVITGTSLRNLGLYSWFAAGVDGHPWATPYDQYNLTDGYESRSLTVHFDPAVDDYVGFGQRVSGWLDPYNGQTATADFGGTSVVTITLPEGAGFESASGAFLTQAVIPAPGALWLMGSAVAALAALGHRFRSPRTPTDGPNESR